jgi:hypothetical protein
MSNFEPAALKTRFHKVLTGKATVSGGKTTGGWTGFRPSAEYTSRRLYL